MRICVRSISGLGAQEVITTELYISPDLLAVPAIVRRVLIERDEIRGRGARPGIAPDIDRVSSVTGAIGDDDGISRRRLRRDCSAGVAVAISTRADPALADLASSRVMGLTRDLIDPIDAEHRQ